MKFRFSIQQYQSDAVKSVTDVFKGNIISDNRYIYDKGNISYSTLEYHLIDDIGYKNSKVSLSSDELLKNIQDIQKNNGLAISTTLSQRYGRCSLDVTMETGTGKTYVYIKTIYELNKLYGWKKFIIVVPSIAIREGVYKSFDITGEHFYGQYNKKIKYFIYDSKYLHQIEDYATSDDINVMIINMQAFATSLKEGTKNKESRIIYSKRDEFGSRRPIDVIKANNPIIILDEPQKMGGEATANGILNFNPLFSISYSATHKEKNNMVYVLDAVDAYKQKLVKKIEVKGIKTSNVSTGNSYVYFSHIILSPDKPPRAKIEIEVSNQNKITKKEFIVSDKSDLYTLSKNMSQYEGFIVAEIDPFKNTIRFTNDIELKAGSSYGNIQESDIRRIQIRETIISHFEKEEKLFYDNIKTLSLFFIDEVAKYRKYDESGNKVKSDYEKIFEEEYNTQLKEKLNTLDKESAYYKYLNYFAAEDVHNGYFSIDKKTKRETDDFETKTGLSKDTDAYDLILKNKEKLLSFNEPTRFIFSHSALREGWDNPNIFQICTLKKSDNTMQKHQEVGRGLRLCVNQEGTRVDENYAKENVMDINLLTVIASESYEDFVDGLQKEISEELVVRPLKITGKENFTGKENIYTKTIVTEQEAQNIFYYLIENKYIDKQGNITDTYLEARANNIIAKMDENDKHLQQTVINILDDIITRKDILERNTGNNARKTKITNYLNDNFYKEEFQKLWNMINDKYVYRISFDSKELVQNTIKYLDENLQVTKTRYTVETGEQKEDVSAEEIKAGTGFQSTVSGTHHYEKEKDFKSSVKYDLLGEISTRAQITRKTAADILQGIQPKTYSHYAVNPEEFIKKVSKVIDEQKGSLIINQITYYKTSEKYKTDIFTNSKINLDSSSLRLKDKCQKHVQDYLDYDSEIENKLADNLEKEEIVKVYSKLPKGFLIPTPVGDYNPDWAIVFDEKDVKYIYFIAETKGDLNSLQFRDSEKKKINCARKLYAALSSKNLKYDVIKDYEGLLGIVKGK